MKLSEYIREAANGDEKELLDALVSEYGKLKKDIKKWASVLKKEGIIKNTKPDVDPQHINPHMHALAITFYFKEDGGASKDTVVSALKKLGFDIDATVATPSGYNKRYKNLSVMGQGGSGDYLAIASRVGSKMFKTPPLSQGWAALAKKYTLNQMPKALKLVPW